MIMKYLWPVMWCAIGIFALITFEVKTKGKWNIFIWAMMIGSIFYMTIGQLTNNFNSVAVGIYWLMWCFYQGATIQKSKIRDLQNDIRIITDERRILERRIEISRSERDDQYIPIRNIVEHTPSKSFEF